MKITKVLLLALTLPCAALAADRNDIQSCYERNGLTDIKPAGTGRELVVIIDQTIPMPDDLQRSSWGQIERFVQAGDRVRLRQALVGVEDGANGTHRIVVRQTMEIEGKDKPALIADTIRMTFS